MPYSWKYIDIETGARPACLSTDADRPIYYVEDQEGDGKQYAWKFVCTYSFMTSFIVAGMVFMVSILPDVLLSMYDHAELQGHKQLAGCICRTARNSWLLQLPMAIAKMTNA